MSYNTMQDYIESTLRGCGCEEVQAEKNRLGALCSFTCGAANEHTFKVWLWLDMKNRNKNCADDWKAAAQETAQRFNPTRRLIALAGNMDDSDDLRDAINAFDKLNTEFVQKLPEIVYRAAGLASAEQSGEMTRIEILAYRIANYEPNELLDLAFKLDELEIEHFDCADAIELEEVLEHCTKDELIEIIMEDHIDPSCDMARWRYQALESVSMNALYAEAQEQADEIATSVAHAIVHDVYTIEFTRNLHRDELDLIEDWELKHRSKER